MEKPAVRAETLLKKAPSQLILSVSFDQSVPKSSRANVVLSTTRVCIDWRFPRKSVYRGSSKTDRKANAAGDYQSTGHEI